MHATFSIAQSDACIHDLAIRRVHAPHKTGRRSPKEIKESDHFPLILATFDVPCRRRDAKEDLVIRPHLMTIWEDIGPRQISVISRKKKAPSHTSLRAYLVEGISEKELGSLEISHMPALFVPFSILTRRH